jgi:hypothetical protein
LFDPNRLDNGHISNPRYVIGAEKYVTVSALLLEEKPYLSA